MCYPKPGPRCSSHAKAKLRKELKQGNRESISLAQKDYDETLQGQRDLRNKLNESSGNKSQKLALRLEKSIQRRAIKMEWLKNTRHINLFTRLFSYDEMVSVVKSNGGLTLLSSGHQPKTGFVINGQDECPKIPEKEFFENGRKLIERFVRKELTLVQNGKSLGIWHDKENHIVVIDKVDIVEDLESAQKIAEKRNQRYMWDVERSLSIKIQ